MKFKLLKRKKNDVILNPNINEKTREKSQGRSMVEMLGVLAIIGVLSIGGIQGYTIAMRKHRANEIANLLTKYAFMVYSGFQNQEMNNDNFVKLNGPFHYSSSGFYFYNCLNSATNKYDSYQCISNQDFTQSGLGGLPSGVSEISASGIGIDKHGNTIVHFWLEFEKGNKEICQAVYQLLADKKQYLSFCADDMDKYYFANYIIVDTDNIFGIEADTSTDNESSYSQD